MNLLIAFLALSWLPSLLAECPNACSGHGSCGQWDQCECCMNWQGADCSERTCPFGSSFADIPTGDLDGSGDISVPADKVIVGSTTFPFGIPEQFPNSQSQEGHFYAECSAKGLCNRDDGVCECFTGYEGTACQRASCPNSCSGHGTCETIKELSEDKEDGDDYSVLDWSAIGGFDYQLWDKVKTMGCKCDSLWEGSDCSLKKCPMGVDPLYRGTPVYEEAFIEFDCPSGEHACEGTFDMVIYDNLGTKYEIDNLPYYPTFGSSDANNTVCDLIMAAFPNDRIQDTVIGTTTYPFCETQLSTAGAGLGMRIQFDYKKGNPGYHKDLKVVAFTPSDTSVTDNTVTYWVEKQGMDAVYMQSDSFDLAIPGYVFDAGIGAKTFNMSTVVGQFITYNNTLTKLNDTQSHYLKIDGQAYKVDKVETITYKDKSDGIYTKISQITLETNLQLSQQIMSGKPVKYPVYTKLTTQYQYVSTCAGRGTCNQEEGQCECFSGYKTINCDTQAPQC